MSKQRVSKRDRRVDFANGGREGVPKLRRSHPERFLERRGAARRYRKNRMFGPGARSTIRVPMNLTGDVERHVSTENCVKKAARKKAQSLVCRQPVEFSIPFSNMFISAKIKDESHTRVHKSLEL